MRPTKTETCRATETSVVGHYSLESLQTTTSYISDDYFRIDC